MFGRTDPLHARAVRFRRVSGVDAYLGAARFIAPKVIDVDGQVVRGSQFVVAIGSRHNLLHPEDPVRARFSVVPSAVFAILRSQPSRHRTAPEIARRLVRVGRSDYADTAYGWALEDSTSFAKFLADPNTRRLLGAHIIGPQASLLLQRLVQAMCLDNTIDQLAHDVVYIHPALSEVVEQALLDLDEPSHR